MTEKNARISAIVMASTAAIASAAYASTATVVVLGTTAAAGAIATKSIMINGAPAVLSKVAASLFTKLAIASVFTLGGLIIAGAFYVWMSPNPIKWNPITTKS